MSSNFAGSKHRHPNEQDLWTVINELPNQIPVSKTELEAIERYFADVVEACLQKQTPNLR